MNTIILSNVEHFRSIAIATGSLEDKTIFIIKEGENRVDFPIRPRELKPVKAVREIEPMRKSAEAGQLWKKPRKR